MSLTSLPAARPGGEAGRRERILEAAERVFAARGFHVATMQDVADGAGMSAGNLYRTFPSKEAIVEGLCARDQQERAANFAKVGQVESVMAAFAAGLREHVVSRPRAKARLMVEIWAEAARNPAIAAMSRAVDADILTQLERMIEIAKQRGEASPSVNSARSPATFSLMSAASCSASPATRTSTRRPKANGRSGCSRLYARASWPRSERSLRHEPRS